MLDIEELQKEQEKKAQTRDYKRINTSLIQEVEKLNRKISFYESAEKNKIKPIISTSKKSDKTQATVLTLFSDYHFEHKILKESVNGLNEYNPDIAKARAEKYFINLVKRIKANRSDVEINYLVIGMIGDLLHGWIHEEYMSSNYYTPHEASLYAEEILESGLSYLINNSDCKIKIICKVGNHSRTTDKIYSSNEVLNSYEYGICKRLERKFKNEIEFLIENNSVSYLEIYDKTISFEHGHNFRYAGGIGGIYVPLVRYLTKSYAIKKFDLACIAHWHSRIHLPNCMINGSICGYDEYARRKGFAFEHPTQQFLLIDSKRGFTINAPIILE